MTEPKNPAGPIRRREMTKIRDRIGGLRTKAREIGAVEVEQELEKVWVELDRLDLRFAQHHDKAPAKKSKKGATEPAT